MIYPNGSKYFCEWKNGEMVGKGTLTFPSGYKYFGKYKDGKKWNVTKYDKKENLWGIGKMGNIWTEHYMTNSENLLESM